jgi:hypothetical protein
MSPRIVASWRSKSPEAARSGHLTLAQHQADAVLRLVRRVVFLMHRILAAWRVVVIAD